MKSQIMNNQTADGDSVLFAMNQAGSMDIYLQGDLEGGVATVLALCPTGDLIPMKGGVISDDGRHVYLETSGDLKMIIRVEGKSGTAPLNGWVYSAKR